MRRCLALPDPTAPGLRTTQPRFRSLARRATFAPRDRVFHCRALAATSARLRRRRRSYASRPSIARSRTARPKPSARSVPSATCQACACRPRASRARMCLARARSRATRAPRGASAPRPRRRCCARRGSSALLRRLSRFRALRTSRVLRDRGKPSDTAQLCTDYDCFEPGYRRLSLLNKHSMIAAFGWPKGRQHVID